MKRSLSLGEMVADTVMVEYVSLVSLEVMVRLPVYRKSAQEVFLDCNMALLELVLHVLYVPRGKNKEFYQIVL